jgi:hypothetical protein
MEQGEGPSEEMVEILDQFALHERCLQEGICPKGCGPLSVKSYKERFCQVCGFVHFNANPERSPHATE